MLEKQVASLSVPLHGAHGCLHASVTADRSCVSPCPGSFCHELPWMFQHQECFAVSEFLWDLFVGSLNRPESATICSFGRLGSYRRPSWSVISVFIHSSNHYMNNGILLHPFCCLFILSSFKHTQVPFRQLGLVTARYDLEANSHQNRILNFMCWFDSSIDSAQLKECMFGTTKFAWIILCFLV